MLFRWTLLEVVQEIALEIGMLGNYEMDINNSTEMHVRGRCRRGLSLREN